MVLEYSSTVVLEYEECIDHSSDQVECWDDEEYHNRVAKHGFSKGVPPWHLWRRFLAESVRFYSEGGRLQWSTVGPRAPVLASRTKKNEIGFFVTTASVQ